MPGEDLKETQGSLLSTHSRCELRENLNYQCLSYKFLKNWLKAWDNFHLFIHPFIHSFNWSLRQAYNVLSNILGARDTGT